MSKIEVKRLGRTYNFVVNNVEFRCSVDWRDDSDMKPIDILINDLSEIIAHLKETPNIKVEEPFKLPPLKPDAQSDTSKNKKV